MVFGWTTVTGDADNGLYALYHSSNVGVQGNRTFTKDAELDKALDEARKTADPEKRQEFYSQAQQRITELAPCVFLLHQENLVAVRDEVKGLKQLPIGLLDLKKVSIEK